MNLLFQEQSKRQILEVRTRTSSRDSSPGELHRAKSMNLPLRRTESDMTASMMRQRPGPVSRTLSSRPQFEVRGQKSEVSKSKSVDNSGRGRSDLRMSSVPIETDRPIRGQYHDPSEALLEMGCLSNYGQPPPSWASSQPRIGSQLSQLSSPSCHQLIHQPPPPAASQHRKLERQLTINPAFDPRINKPEQLSQLSSPHQQLLTSEAIEYMHRNPPPPFGLVNIAETSQQPIRGQHSSHVIGQSEAEHQNVTRNASAPDSIKHWPGEVMSMEAARGATLASPGERLSSGSDTQLNRPVLAANQRASSRNFDQLEPVTKTFSSPAEPWTFSNQFDTGMSPLLGSSIWSAASANQRPAFESRDPNQPIRGLASPPASPSRNLGPVGSRPANQRPAFESHDHQQQPIRGPHCLDLEAGDRAQQFTNLCNIFPRAQVEAVMSLLPHERDTAVLCKKIVDLYT